MERSSFDVLAELFERDVDLTLLRRAQAKTPTERIVWLEEMQAFAESARRARESSRGSSSSRCLSFPSRSMCVCTEAV